MIIFTDGSSKKINNIWHGGVGVYYYKNKQHNISKHFTNMTNQKAELYACFLGIKKGLKISDKIIVYLDSKYVINCITKWFETWEKTKKENIKYFNIIKKLYFLVKKYNIILKYVKSHVKKNNLTDKQWFKYKYNNKADKLAKKYLKEILL